MSKPGNMLIAQSGGPTVAINASLAGAVEAAMRRGEIGEIYGARHGIEGVLRDDLLDLRELLKTDDDLRRLRVTPAMALGSCRKRLEETPGEEYRRVLEVFKSHDIRYFFYIGGNDSMDTVKKLSEWFGEIGEDIKAVGIPKTIDNDVAGTDHTPGFGSAARYIAYSMAETECDSDIYDIPTVVLMEIMGRNAGWLTAASVLARRPGCSAPHMICLPEVPFDMDKFIGRIDELRREKKHIMIAASEGLRYADGSYVASSDKLDVFGHKQLAGVGHKLAIEIKREFGCKVRAIEPNILQRAAGHLSSETDIAEASSVGAKAVELALKGETGVMANIIRLSNDPYTVEYGSADIEGVANLEQKVPIEWIDGDRFDVKQPLVDYLRPLIRCPSLPDPAIPIFTDWKPIK